VISVPGQAALRRVTLVYLVEKIGTRFVPVAGAAIAGWEAGKLIDGDSQWLSTGLASGMIWITGADRPDEVAAITRGANSAAPAGAPPPDDDKPTRATNPKHHANSQSPEPENAQELYENSVADKNGVRWAKDADGNIHRFSKPSNGETHWNGSTAGSDPIQSQNIPVEIRRLLGFKG
jgi:hypothetical protein